MSQALGQELIERAIARHGGFARWRRIAAIDLRVAALSGPLLAAKGLGRTFAPPGRVTIEPHRARALWHDWPGPGQRGVYCAGQVAIVDTDAAVDVVVEPAEGREVFPDASHRASFRGLRKWRRWRDLDGLYFFGYALAHYLSLPFRLRETEVVRARRLADGSGAVWCRMPPAWHTHSRFEGFRFDATGLLIRHDYRADVISALACGGHRTWDYREVSGFLIAARRAVRVRLGHRPRAPMTPIPVLRASFTDLAVRFAD